MTLALCQLIEETAHLEPFIQSYRRISYDKCSGSFNSDYQVRKKRFFLIDYYDQCYLLYYWNIYHFCGVPSLCSLLLETQFLAYKEIGQKN